MPASFILFFIIIAIVIVVGGILSHRHQEARRDALTHLAHELGWQFDPAKNRYHADEFDQFAVFTTGQSRYAYNTLRGTLAVGDVDCSCQMGDYHYQTTSGTGKNRRTQTHLFSYLLVKLPYDGVPNLTIREEHLFDRMASFLGFDDIDFESAEFSDRFHVKSKDKRFAYAVVHPRMMEFLLAQKPPMIDLQRGYCCIYNPGKSWTAEQFRPQTDWTISFFSHWPRHLTSRLQGSTVQNSTADSPPLPNPSLNS